MKKVVNVTKKRRDEVIDMLCRGYTSKTIITTMTNKYEVGVKSIENDITKGYKLIRDSYPEDTANLIKEHYAKYDQIIEDCTIYLDPSNKIKAMTAKEKLAGLHKPDVAVQVNNNTLNAQLGDLNVEELKKLLND